MKKMFLVLAFLLVGCGYLVDEQSAIRAMEDQGFTNVKIVEESRVFPILGGCSDSDTAAFGMNAINSQGKLIGATVCVGWPFKGSTIRYK